jgi:ribokinase
VPSLLVCGAINWDTTLFVDKLPSPGEEIKVSRTLSVPGGKGGNTAVAAARILGTNNVGIIGMVGSDAIGDRQIQILENEGVDTSCVNRHKDLPSGQAYVVVDRSGENIILTHRAANWAMTRESVFSENIASAIDRSSIMIIIDPPIEVAVALAARAKSAGKIVVFSPSTLVSHGITPLEPITEMVDYWILNEHEAASLAGVEHGFAACKKLSERLGGRRVITTLGSTGCMISSEGKSTEVPSVDLSLLGLKVSSTVGAGDTFQGAFASFKHMGLEDLEALFLSNIAAALKITKEDTRGSPTYDEILKLVERDPFRSTHQKFKHA